MIINVMVQCCLFSLVLFGLCIQLKLGQSVDNDVLLYYFILNGYVCIVIVMEFGDFVVCGGVIDVFLLDGEELVWFDFFGDSLESIWIFDLEIQCL